MSGRLKVAESRQPAKSVGSAKRIGKGGPGTLQELALALTRWFEANHRELPWRIGTLGKNPILNPKTNLNLNPTSLLAEPSGKYQPLFRRDPYATWISEIMLQQTQVATVVDYFQRWMKLFPNVLSLASAAESDVLAAWAGLGYYSRARNLLVTARKIAKEFGGVFPSHREDLLALKGVGEYTSGAIASLAFDKPEPILDGNIVRVFSRLYGLDYLPMAKHEKEHYWTLSRAWVNSGSPALINEGLMELGALVCTSKSPECKNCPLKFHCLAFANGKQSSFPPPKPRKENKEISALVVIAQRNAGGAETEEVLLYRPNAKELLTGLLTFPIFEVSDINALKMEWAKRLPGVQVPAFRLRPTTFKHSITHHRIHLQMVSGIIDFKVKKKSKNKKGQGFDRSGFQWLSVIDLERLLVSSLTRKIWKAYREQGG
jgi:A/G-specific adenine glycosylase